MSTVLVRGKPSSPTITNGKLLIVPGRGADFGICSDPCSSACFSNDLFQIPLSLILPFVPTSTKINLNCASTKAKSNTRVPFIVIVQ